MHVLAIVSQKGGSGKTTLALSLAVAAQRDGKTAAIVDLDPQATAATWADRRQGEPPFVVSAQPTRIVQVLKAAEDAGADIVFIDTPPHSAQAGMAAIKAADLVLLPCRPAIFDLDTVPTTLELIALSGSKPVLAVLNGVPPRGTKGEQAADVLRDLNIVVCPVVLGYRAAFSDSVALGQTSQEYEAAGKGAHEVEEVYRFMCQHLHTATTQHINSKRSA